MSKLHRDKGFTLIELLVVIAIIAILAAILFPVFARAREKARQTTCSSNQRQIGASAQMYAQDHDETLPASANFWTSINVDAGVLVCPTLGKGTPNGYAYNVWINGMTVGQVNDPSSAVLTADWNTSGSAGANLMVTNSTDLDYRHTNQAIVNYLDGHVATVNTTVQLNPNPVIVNNYNWLQLPATYITPTIGSTGSAGTSYGNGPADFRWGNWVWIPSAGCAGGTKDYWATLTLDQPRNISSVRVQYWADGNDKIRRFWVQGSTDGKSFGNIGYYDFPGGYTQNTSCNSTTAVYPPIQAGLYLAIRVYFYANDSALGGIADYQNTGGGYGGPGIQCIEPIGNGTLNVPTSQVPTANCEVNWANKGMFPSVTATAGPFGGSAPRANLRYVDGFLYDDDGGSGTSPWPAYTGTAGGNYVQVDLGKIRSINQCLIKWDGLYTGNSSFNIWTSNDGTTFTKMTTGLTFLNYDNREATGYSFPNTSARYWRITDATGGSYDFVDQFMLYGPG